MKKKLTRAESASGYHGLKFSKPVKKKKSWSQEMDKHCLKLWYKIVRLKANNRCQRPNCPFCFNQENAKYLQAHHIISRTKWALRHDTQNGVLLCRSSHQFWAHNTDMFIQAQVIEFYKTLGIWDYLQLRRTNKTKLDYKLIELDLLQQLKKYEG